MRIAAASYVFLFAMAGCGGTLDAGHDNPDDSLPFDSTSPVVLCNDGPFDNWQGEYAMLFANTGGPPLEGIVIHDSLPWPTLEDNVAGWQDMVDAARDSGLQGIPDPISSNGPALVRPEDGDIESTLPNESAGARFILELSERLAQPSTPLVAVVGGRLTDVADAYLMDHTVAERVIVVAALGSTTAEGGEMGTPNGELDAWANVIVVQNFRYVQVSAFYDQAEDFPNSVLDQLPTNAFTGWITEKQPHVWEAAIASDQVGIFTVAVPSFAAKVSRVAEQGANADGIPLLANTSGGGAWLVSEIDDGVARERLWEALLSPSTFSQ